MSLGLKEKGLYFDFNTALYITCISMPNMSLSCYSIDKYYLLEKAPFVTEYFPFVKVRSQFSTKNRMK